MARIELLHCCLALQVFLEDAGYDWKLLGTDVPDIDYVAWHMYVTPQVRHSNNML